MDKFDIFEVEIDCLTAKAAMQKMMQYLEAEAVNTVEIITLGMLVQEQDNPEWKENLRNMDIVISGDCEILKAAEITDRTILKETESRVFLKMFCRYLQKNAKKVFLVSQTEAALHELEQAMVEYNRGINIVGGGILVEDGSRDETVINEINGVESDCVISILPSPQQEDFIQRNQALLNTKLWMGCGNFFEGQYTNLSQSRKVWQFFIRKLFQYRIGKEKKSADE